MTFSRDESAGYLVNHMGRLFARHLEAELKPLGLALGAFPALLYLWEHEGLTQKELVQKLGIEQPTLAATLTRMERDGLITRRVDAGDARVQRIYLTAKARALEAPATTAASRVNDMALDGLTVQDRKAFLALTRQIIGRLTAAHP